MNYSEHKRKLDSTLRHYLALDQAPGAAPQAGNNGKAQLDRIVTLLREAVRVGKLDQQTFAAAVKALGGSDADIAGQPAPAPEPETDFENMPPPAEDGPNGGPDLAKKLTASSMFPDMAKIKPDENWGKQPEPTPYKGMSAKDGAAFDALYPDIARIKH